MRLIICIAALIIAFHSGIQAADSLPIKILTQCKVDTSEFEVSALTQTFPRDQFGNIMLVFEYTGKALPVTVSQSHAIFATKKAIVRIDSRGNELAVGYTELGKGIF